MEKIIRVFVSSTYLDLKLEREAVAEAIDSIVVPGIKFESKGMENFFASNNSPLEYAKDVIDQCDYYVLLIGARYGTIPEGSELSYTEQEYDYAMAKEIPILAFIHSKPSKFQKKFLDKENKPLLDKFITKVKGNKKTLKYWDDNTKIASYVVGSLTHEISTKKPSSPPGELKSAPTPKPSEQSENTQNQEHDNSKPKLTSLEEETSPRTKQFAPGNMKKPLGEEDIKFLTSKIGLAEKLIGLISVLLTLILIIAKTVPPVPPPDVLPTIETTQLDVQTITKTTETKTQIPTDIFPEETEIVPTFTLSPTIFPTSTPAPPESLTPTPTMSPTITPDYTLATYRIGVFEQDPTNCVKVDENERVYENFNRSDEIVDELHNIGFTVFKVPLSVDVVLDKYDVLYMPNGWACTDYSNYILSIRKFLDGTGKGLLIGDPKPSGYFSLNLFPNLVTDFNDMTPEDTKGQEVPEVMNKAKTQHFQVMLEEEEPSKYPRAETKLTIYEPEDLKLTAKYTFINVLCYDKLYNYHCSLVASDDPENAFADSHVPRFIIMPGSEYPVSDFAISAELMKKILLWLAHAPAK